MVDHQSSAIQIKGESPAFAGDVQGNAASSNGTLHRPACKAAAAISVSAEIDLPPSTNCQFEKVDCALAACDPGGKKENICEASDAIVRPALSRAYDLFLEIKDDERAHRRAIADILKNDIHRERDPSLKKPSYNATCRAFHPKEMAHYKTCSEQSNFLTAAALSNVPKGGFEEWAKGKSLAQAKALARQAKRAIDGKPKKPKKPIKLQLPYTELELPQLARALAADSDHTAEALKAAFGSLEIELAAFLDAGDVGTLLNAPEPIKPVSASKTESA